MIIDLNLDDRKRKQKLEVSLPPNASSCLASFPSATWKDSNASAAFAALCVDGEPIARHRLMLPVFKEMHWPKASVRICLEENKAVFTCDKFALAVCLDLGGEIPLEDNFFDLYPGMEYAIAWPEEKPPVVLFIGNELGDNAGNKDPDGKSR